MKKHRLVCAVAIVNGILLLVCFFCLARAMWVINTFRHPPLLPYTETESGVQLTLPSEKTVHITFGENAVRVTPCAFTSHEDARCIVSFIRRYADDNGISIPRNSMDLIGEVRLHAILATLGYKPEHTDQADLDYTRDHRPYVNVVGRCLGVLGV